MQAFVSATHRSRPQDVRQRGVPSAISRSWSRCESYGLDPAMRHKPIIMTKGELRERLQEHEALFQTCYPELESLRRVATTSESAVIVADADGLILESLGAASFSERAVGVALRPGALWSEKACGTNGIGAVLMERRPLSVRGVEHYLETNRFLDCAAAPIVTPFGGIAGVLNVSAPASAVSAHALGLVELAVDQIEHRFFQSGFDRCIVLRLHTDSALLGTPREGILVFDGSRLVAANRHGLALMSLEWNDLGSCDADILFDKDIGRDPNKLFGQKVKDSVGRTIFISPETPPAKMAARAPAVARAKAPETSLSGPLYDAATRTEIERARRVIECGLPVVVTGETGSGKEVFARQLHASSSRAGAPFIAVNCAALPESLIESELFGYAEGAFTGANRRGSKGMIREAAGGTLLLDEIGDMPLGLQARLLRVLQERQVIPLGSGKPVAVDFALICATHRNLNDLVAEGRFRQDLYFRISQYHVELSPVRTRPDRRQLVLDAWKRASGADARYVLGDAALQVLSDYAWPGNYRELCGTMKALFALAQPDRVVEVKDLPRHLTSSGVPVAQENATGKLEAAKMAALQKALDQNKGNISKAAKSLGVSRGLFYRRLLQSSLYKGSV